LPGADDGGVTLVSPHHLFFLSLLMIKGKNVELILFLLPAVIDCFILIIAKDVRSIHGLANISSSV
jgi:hypothetical protein